MSVAVRQFKKVMGVITRRTEGATASEIASELNMERQAAVRLLDAMVKDPLVRSQRTAWP